MDKILSVKSGIRVFCMSQVILVCLLTSKADQLSCGFSVYPYQFGTLVAMASHFSIKSLP